MIWIIGEYSDHIENADELLEQFLDLFVDEPAQVQLQVKRKNQKKEIFFFLTLCHSC